MRSASLRIVLSKSEETRGSKDSKISDVLGGRKRRNRLEEPRLHSDTLPAFYLKRRQQCHQIDCQ